MEPREVSSPSIHDGFATLQVLATLYFGGILRVNSDIACPSTNSTPDSQLPAPTPFLKLPNIANTM